VVELAYTAWDMRAFARDVWTEAGDWEQWGMVVRQEILRRWSENQGERDAAGSSAAARDAAPHDPLPAPFRWNDERRARIRAELNARIAWLYGLTRDELRSMLDPADVYGPDVPGETFRVLKEKEIQQYGEYRTRRMALEAWDRAVRTADGGSNQYR
ncbi:MAG: hypothetical protein NZ555_17450, partial [Geminicoccaceae bacterium]|nr:hypothetical protein [Geminicoccaceae bacterium]